MWLAISYVTSGLALVAFVFAVAAWTFKSRSEERERLIRSAKESDRAELVKNALEFFNIDASDLTKDQQFKLALEQIQARGRRFTISAIVVCFLAIVAVGITAYTVTQHGHSSELNSDLNPVGVDPALVGSWEGVGKVENTDVQLRFEIGEDGKFSRRYFVDDGGVIEIENGKLRLNGSVAPMAFEADYSLVGANTLILKSANGAREFKRVGQDSDPENLLAGTWKTTLLLGGANWEWTLEIGAQHNYHGHAETRDNGKLAAQNGNYRTISNWSSTPLVGTYEIIAGKPQLNIWPFGTIELQRAH